MQPNQEKKGERGELWEENEEMIESYFKESIPHIGRNRDEMCRLIKSSSIPSE